MEAKDKLIEKLKELVQFFLVHSLHLRFEEVERIRFKQLQAEIASLEQQIADSKPEMFIAKSGRKYRHVPVDMDIETWDAMTPVQRLEYKGLLRNAPVFDDSKVSEIEYCVQSFIRSQHLTKQWDEFRDAWFEVDSKEIPAGAEDKTINEILKPLVFDDETLLDSVGELDFVSRNDAERAMEEYATLKVKEALQSNNLKNE